jgi:hypothetical protein
MTLEIQVWAKDSHKNVVGLIILIDSKIVWSVNSCRKLTTRR